MSESNISRTRKQEIEPLLQDADNRYVLLPIRHNNLFKLYKKALASFWTVEEVDLSKRIKTFGFKSMFFAKCNAYHVGGGVSQQVKAKRLFYSLRSRILYSKKHFNFLSYLAIYFLSLLVEPISRILFSLLRLDFKAISETICAYKLLLSWTFKR